MKSLETTIIMVSLVLVKNIFIIFYFETNCKSHSSSAALKESGPFRRFSTCLLQNACINTVRHAVVCGIYIFFWIFNFIKEIVCICIVFFKKLKPLLLYLAYELVQIYITFNRTDVSLFNPSNLVWIPKDQ